MSKERLLWLDIAKGIAIILVVLGHSSLPVVLNRFIFTFHVPVFFFAAGMTNDFTKSWKPFLARKARTLLLPFAVYSIIILFMRSFVFELTFGELALNFLREGWMGVPLWFVPVLFVSLLVVRLTFDIEDEKLRCAVWLLLPLISIDLCHFRLNVPWNMAVAPFASILVVLGHYMKQPLTKQFGESKKYILGGVLSLIVTIGISAVCRLDMCFNQVLPATLILIGSVSGSYMVFAISKFIEDRIGLLSRILQAIGKETYLILAFAEIIIVYLNYFFDFNVLVKYGIMVVALYLLCFVRKLSRL